jgi:membrane-associated phospholipid phosphatase
MRPAGYVHICRIPNSRRNSGVCERTCIRIVLHISIILAWSASADAADRVRDLSDGSQAAIYGLSAGVFAMGAILEHFDSDTASVTAYRPNRIDAWFRARLRGGGSQPSNFLDNSFGGKLTPLLACSAIGAIDIHRREFSRDVPFFVAGQALTAGITGITKSLLSRPRPYMQATDRRRGPDRNHHHSFFSGHTSSAFYAMGFLNLVFRRHMRRHWTTDEYRVGRWISPLVAFGWASYVGYSRIQADRHYFTDVAAGAVAGLLVAGLYYNLAYDSIQDDRPERSTSGFFFRMSF